MHSHEKLSKLDVDAYVELAACEVVGHSVADFVDIGHPVISAYIADVKKVEDIKSEPYAF